MEALNQTCPNCSGRLEHTGSGILVCPFCDAEFFSKIHAEHADEIVASRKDEREEYEEYEEYDEELTDEEIQEIVQDAVEEYEDHDGYGVQIGLDGAKMSKESKARVQFGIPNDEELYMIYDETMFGSCKEGYVITSAAFYMRDTDGEVRIIPWEDFADVKIKEKNNNDLKIDGYLITLTGTGGRDYTYDMLVSIKEGLQGY